ncbi:MAG: hypothetical protein HY293_14185 [Planctomycetes bacterium]|nr:hypothetical protein [Planctomycetota bacterium]
MKRSTSIPAALILAVTVGGVVALYRVTEPRRTRAKLMELEGVDLRASSGPARARVESLFNRFAEPGAAGISARTGPMTVLRLAPDTAAERLLLVRTADIGGDQSVMVWDVDKGYLDARIWEENESRIESMRASFRPEVDAWCIEALISKSGERARQFRLLREGRFVLVRVEDEKGRALPMPQGLRMGSVGGTAEEWASLLTS